MKGIYLKIQFSRDRGRIKIDKRDEKDMILCRHTSSYNSDEHFKKGAVALSISVDVLMYYVDKYEKSKEATQEYELQANPIDDFTVFVRGLDSPLDSSISYHSNSPIDCLSQALSNNTLTYPQPIIYWDNTKHLAAVDLDVVKGSNDIDLPVLLSTFNPCPSFAWITHGKGLRLIYTSQDIFTAEELAALAIYTLSFTLEYTNLELKCNTRHPMYEKGGTSCGEVFTFNQTTEISNLMKYLRRFTVDDKEVQDWLTEYDYEKGKRYPHTRCPVEPSKTGKTDCVLIGEKGIKCYICEAHGVTYGSHKPGFFPYSAFISTTDNTLLYKCVKNYCHYSHAKFILSSRFGISGNFTRLCYSGLLKAINNSYDSRINDSLYRGSNFIRIDNQWMTEGGDVYSKDLKPLLSTLPACQIMLKNGSVKVDMEKLTKFQQTHDLTEYGYPSLSPIWGHKIGSYYLEGELSNKIFAVIQRSVFNGSDVAHLRPAYIKGGNVDAAWRTIDSIFPGINHNLVYLIIAARGCIELEYGLPPFIFITGVTSAGKTGTIELCAGIIGDNCNTVVWTNNIERVREAILVGKQDGSYICFNEMIKESKAKKQSPVAALDFILNLTKNSSSHQMYIGPVKLGTLPVVCFTDTGLPIEVKTDKQLARRIVHIDLPSRIEWVESIKRHGLSEIQNLRLISQKVADACNVIMSYVIDKYFGSPLTFMDIGELLGFNTLSSSDEAEDMDNTLRIFFEVLCKTQKLTGTDAVRWSGRGWKCINKSDTKSDILNAWLEVCDGSSELGFTTSRRCEEVDWQKIMQLKEPCKLEIRAHGISKIAVRFKSIAGNKQDYRVNEELYGRNKDHAGK